MVDGEFANYDAPPCTTLEMRGPCLVYVLTAPTTGTLTARVDYDALYYGILLEVKIDNTTFKTNAHPWSPVIGRLAVTAGRTYQIAVGIWGADEGPVGKFKLSTALE